MVVECGRRFLVIWRSTFFVFHAAQSVISLRLSTIFYKSMIWKIPNNELMASGSFKSDYLIWKTAFEPTRKSQSVANARHVNAMYLPTTANASKVFGGDFYSCIRNDVGKQERRAEFLTRFRNSAKQQMANQEHFKAPRRSLPTSAPALINTNFAYWLTIDSSGSISPIIDQLWVNRKNST